MGDDDDDEEEEEKDDDDDDDDDDASTLTDDATGPPAAAAAGAASFGVPFEVPFGAAVPAARGLKKDRMSPRQGAASLGGAGSGGRPSPEKNRVSSLSSPSLPRSPSEPKSSSPPPSSPPPPPVRRTSAAAMLVPAAEGSRPSSARPTIFTCTRAPSPDDPGKFKKGKLPGVIGEIKRADQKTSAL